MAIGENSSLEIGQIIYVLSNKAQKIIPAIVVEEITVKTINGNQSSWKVSVGPAGKEKTIDSKLLDGELYGSIEEVQGVLTTRLNSFIQQIVNDAQLKVASWYGGTKPAAALAATVPDKVDPESLVDESESAAPTAKKAASSRSKQADEVRKKALAMVSPENSELPTDSVMNDDEIVLPGGHKVKVNIRTS